MPKLTLVDRVSSLSADLEYAKARCAAAAAFAGPAADLYRQVTAARAASLASRIARLLIDTDDPLPQTRLRTMLGAVWCRDNAAAIRA